MRAVVYSWTLMAGIFVDFNLVRDENTDPTRRTTPLSTLWTPPLLFPFAFWAKKMYIHTTLRLHVKKKLAFTITIGRHVVIAIFGPIPYCFSSVQEPVYHFLVFFAKKPKHTVHSTGKTKQTAASVKKTERKLGTLLHRAKPSQQDRIRNGPKMAVNQDGARRWSRTQARCYV